MNLNMTAPCANCPFRKVGAIALRPGRLDGIIADLQADDYANFACHKTVRRPTEESMCIGSAVYAWKARRPSVGVRLAIATGLLDPATLEAHAAAIIDPPPRKA